MGREALARQVGGWSAATPAAPGLGRPPLIARGRELSALRAALLAPPSITAVEGETGVGKTSLVRAALADPSLTHTTKLVGHCRPFQEPFPLTPVVEALAAAAARLPARSLNPVAGALRPLLPELAEHLPPAPEPLPGARAERQRLFRAVVALLDAVAPTVLVIEDIHWMDGPTEEFLRYLGGAVPRGVTVVLTFRPEDLDITQLDWFARRPPDETTTRLRLEPFDASGVADMARAHLAVDAVSPDFIRFLEDCTAGLPFALDEVLRLMEERGEVIRRNGAAARRSDELLVPPAVRDTILVRLRRLSPTAQDIAAAAAVVAGPASPALLAEVAGHSEPDTVAALAELYAAWLLHDSGADLSEFRHALARQAVEESLPPPRMRQLHLAAARALEAMDRPPAAELARHYRQACSTADWVRCAEAAARTASGAGNHAVAVALLDDVFALDGLDGDTLYRLALIYAEAAVQARAHRHAAAVLADIVDDVPLSEGRRGRLRFHRGYLLSQSGAVDEVSSEVARAIEELEGLPEAGTAMTFLAYPWIATLHRSEHLAWLTKARDTAQARQDATLRGRIDRDAAAIFMQVGDPRGSPAVRRQLQDVGLPPRERVRLAYNAALGGLMTGHYAHARTFLEIASDTVVDTPRFIAPLAGLEAWWRWMTGRWDELDGRVTQLAEGGADSPTASALAEVIGASLQVARGELDAGVSRLAGAADTTIQAGELLPHLLACGQMTRTARGRGDVEAALAAGCRGLSLVETKGMWAWAGEIVPWVVQVLAETGDQERAAEVVDSLGAHLDGLDAPAAAAGWVHSTAVLAVTGSAPSDAAELYREAALAWDRLPRPHLSALCAAERGRLMSRTDPDAAGSVLRGAYVRLAELGAQWDARRVAQDIRGLGKRIGHRGGRKAYGSQLSPREREVARLAAAGHTNRQIAESLVLSPRTVERHVASVLRKLGISSRRAISAHLVHVGG